MFFFFFLRDSLPLSDDPFSVSDSEESDRVITRFVPLFFLFGVSLEESLITLVRLRLTGVSGSDSVSDSGVLAFFFLLLLVDESEKKLI